MSLKALIIYIHLPWCIYGFIISCLNDSVSWLFCLYSFYQPPTSSSLPFIFLKYISDNVACLLKKKNQRTISKYLGVACEPPCNVSLILHSTHFSNLCSVPIQRSGYRGLPVIPRYSRTLCLVGTFLCTECPPLPIQQGPAQTLPLLWTYHHSSLLYPPLLQPK